METESNDDFLALVLILAKCFQDGDRESCCWIPCTLQRP